MALEALLFDVDGTLVDTEELHRRAFNQAFLEFELGWDWSPEVYAPLLRISGGNDRSCIIIDSSADFGSGKIAAAPSGAWHCIARKLASMANCSRQHGEAAAGDRAADPEARAAGLKIGLRRHPLPPMCSR